MPGIRLSIAIYEIMPWATLQALIILRITREEGKNNKKHFRRVYFLIKIPTLFSLR